MADEDVKITAKLSLDTSEAEQSLSDIGKGVKSKTLSVDIPDDTSLKLPKDATKSLDAALKGPKSLKGVGVVLKGMTAGLNGAMHSISSVTNAISSPKVAGIITLIIAAISALIKLMSGTDTWKQMVDAFKRLKNLFSDKLASNIAVIGDIITSVVNIVTDLLGPILDIASKIFDVTMKPLMGILKLIERIVALITPFLQLVADFWTGVIDVFGKILDFDTTTTGKQTGGYKTSLDTWQTSGSDLAEVADSTDETKNILERFGDAFGKAFNSFVELIVGLFKGIWDRLKEHAAEIVNGIFSLGQTIASWISTAVNGIGQFFQNVFQGVGQWIVNVYGAVSNWIVSAVQDTAQWISDVYTKVKDWIVSAIQSIVQGLQGFGDTVANGGKGEGFGGGLFNGSGRWGDGYQAGDVIGSVGDFFQGVVGKGWLWASGGTLDVGAQVWGMNEQGNPEFMFNAGGHDTVINKEILSDAMYQALTKANGTGGKLKLEVTVDKSSPSGPKELVQMLLPSLKFALK